MGIVRFALRFPHTFYVLAALILFLGITAIRAMPTDIFPEIRIPVVTVIWSYTGLSTPEIDQRVTTYSQYSISSNVSDIKCGKRAAGSCGVNRSGQATDGADCVANMQPSCS